jgi:hypothetical protein
MIEMMSSSFDRLRTAQRKKNSETRKEFYQPEELKIGPYFRDSLKRGISPGDVKRRLTIKYFVTERPDITFDSDDGLHSYSFKFKEKGPDGLQSVDKVITYRHINISVPRHPYNPCRSKRQQKKLNKRLGVDKLILQLNEKTWQVVLQKIYEGRANSKRGFHFDWGVL